MAVADADRFTTAFLTDEDQRFGRIRDKGRRREPIKKKGVNITRGTEEWRRFLLEYYPDFVHVK